MVKRLFVAMVLMLGVCILPLSNLVISYVSTIVEEPAPGVVVKYYRSVLSPQIFRIVIENVSGERYPTTVSMYGWLPNGSIVDLGEFLGEDGIVDVGVSKVVEFLKRWCAYLESRGDNPLWVEVGIIIIGAIHTPFGVYGIVKSVPLNMVRLLRGSSVEIELVNRLVRENLLVPMNEVMKDIESLECRFVEYSSSNASTIHTLLREVLRGYCYCGKVLCYCYKWELDRVFTRIGEGIPMIAIRIHGDVGKVNGVTLHEHLASMGWGMCIAFGVPTVMEGDAEVRYEISGFSIRLGGYDHVWLDYSKTFYVPPNYPNLAMLIAIGMRSDLAFARYRLELCDNALIRCKDLGIYLDMVLARPDIENNEVEPWEGVDTAPYDGVGDLEHAFWYIATHWDESSERVGNYVDINAITVERDIATLPLFSLSIAVTPLLPGSVRDAMAVVASVPVGTSRESSSLTNNYCVIQLRSGYVGSYVMVAKYFYSPTRFRYGDGEYSIGSLYIDVVVSRSIR